MGENPHGYTINDPSPLYCFDFPHEYWKIIHSEAIFDRLQNFKDIIRMGTGFSHNVECLFSYAKWRICAFYSVSSLLLACADQTGCTDGTIIMQVEESGNKGRTGDGGFGTAPALSSLRWSALPFRSLCPSFFINHHLAVFFNEDMMFGELGYDGLSPVIARFTSQHVQVIIFGRDGIC
jgi:hypothetical protein